MNRLDKLLAAAITMPAPEIVTLTYADGTQEVLGAFDATMAVLEAQIGGPAIVATDQPTGSLIWAILSSNPIRDLGDEIPELGELQEDEKPTHETSAFQEAQEIVSTAPSRPERKGLWPDFM